MGAQRQTHTPRLKSQGKGFNARFILKFTFTFKTFYKSTIQ